MTVPAARPRQRFPEIAAVSWEHPADRAALQSLRALPVLAADAAATPATVSRKRPASRAAAPKKKPRAG